MRVMPLVLVLVLALGVALAAEPETPGGATVTSTSTLPSYSTGTAGSDQAAAGEVHQVDISVETITQWWAGFIGNVVETVVLGSGTSKLYEWSVSDPSGWLYLSPSSTPDFTTTDGDLNTQKIVNAGIWGSTPPADENFETTFKYVDDGGANDLDATAESQCGGDGTNYSTDPRYIRTYDNTGSESDNWITCGLEDGSGNIIFKVKVVNDQTGFNGSAVDYQALVPASTSGTTYYFFKA